MCHVVMCALWNEDGNMNFVFVLWECESTFAPWLWKQWCWMMCAWGVTLCPVQQCRLIAWVCGLGNVILFLCYSGGTTHSPSLLWLWYIGVALCLAGSHLICFFVRLHLYCCLPFAPWLWYGGTVYLWSVRAALWPPPYSASVVLLYQPTVRGHWVLCQPIYSLTTVICVHIIRIMYHKPPPKLCGFVSFGYRFWFLPDGCG